MNLLANNYWLDVAIEQGMGIPVDYWKDVLRFDVYNEKGEVGIARMDHSWKISTYNI